MHVPLVDLRAQLGSLREAILRAVTEVIDSTQYIGGPKVEELERRLAAYVGTREAIGVSSGTDALLVALMAIDVGPGDIVLTTPYSFFSTAGSIARLGARAAFVDIEPDSYNMDPLALAAWFDEHRAEATKVKAILPVHLFGQTAEMDPIRAIAKQHGSALIEDAAQAIGASYPSREGTRRAGALGDLGCFSFYPSKNLGGIGDGGLVTTDDLALAEKIRALRSQGSSGNHHHALIGGNFRLDPIQAAVLLVKLEHLEGWHEARRRNAAYYDAKLEIEGLETPRAVHGREHHTYNQYVIRTPDRDRLRAFLRKAGVATEIYYPIPLHQQACLRQLGYRPGDLPKAEAAAARSLALPIYPELSDEMKDYVIAKLGEFYSKATSSKSMV